MAGYGISYGSYEQVKNSKWNDFKIKKLLDTEKKWRVRPGFFNVSKKGVVYFKAPNRYGTKELYSYRKGNNNINIITKISENILPVTEPKIIGDYVFLIYKNANLYDFKRIKLNGAEKTAGFTF